MLTGNLEQMAWHRLSQLGIDHYFEKGQGAFGSDGEDRNTYVAVALKRANKSPQEAVVIGDTVRDIACARAGGVYCIAVATGTTEAEHLHTADKVIDSFDQLPSAISSLLDQ
jgi:phosphoglycolate phosphatase-like HAD superfamily hydrolase